ncbi:winged helix-turn-helix transcriptional regulator [Saccharothrix coeruleofusca]|uniref:Transcriptional regulator n=1 Tax=Saccharothrix coeruleofusca TaxID=33919 RepID=A0A918EG70_9PSEU|nr:helix-turn-helix domain-containing protein [Saccharothrix coeruleofusca]MBP2335582.1 DNA-binding HxlR family transcriptional regulator [Saccharothrix coeruleofusca]GGP79584.1 transcriptional regulator [Saccharothrix coeruleofusca]
MDETPRLATARTLLAADTFEQNCPTRAVLDHVTNRWATLILAALTAGPHRFSALQSRVAGISHKMLSQNLKTLVAYGLVDRSVEPTVPPRVTYRLTGLGEELTEPLCALIHWIGRHTEQLLTARAEHALTTS